MKKKLLALLLCGMLALATACGNTPSQTVSTPDPEVAEATPFMRLSAANESQEAVSSMAMDFVMDMEMVYQDEPLMQYVMSGDICVSAEDASDIRFSMKTNNSVAMLGESEEMGMDAYYLDGYYYMSIQGQNLKVEMPMEAALDQTATVPNVEFDEQYILSQTAEGNELTFVIQGDSMTEFFDEAMGDALASLGEATLTYGDVTYKARLTDDNALLGMDMECSMEIEVMGEAFSATIKMSTNVKDTGSSVTVVYPDDLDDYIEVDASMLDL